MHPTTRFVWMFSGDWYSSALSNADERSTARDGTFWDALGLAMVLHTFCIYRHKDTHGLFRVGAVADTAEAVLSSMSSHGAWRYDGFLQHNVGCYDTYGILGGCCTC